MPESVTLDGYTENGYAFGGVVFGQIHWRGWGSGQATAPGTIAYFVAAGEAQTVTLVAFDLGKCGSAFSYRALTWPPHPQDVNYSVYYDTCTGRGVGAGFPGYSQERVRPS